MSKVFAYPLRLLNGFFDRVFALTGAMLLAQFPQFYGQYLQRLAGHLDEARRTMVLYEESAASLGLTLEQYIEQHLVSDSAVFVSAGEVITSLLERLHQLERSLATLVEAPPLFRWWIFLQEAEWPIMMQTWRDFTPGLPTTIEGLLYAATGLLIGWSCYSLGKLIFQKLLRLFKRRPAHS